MKISKLQKRKNNPNSAYWNKKALAEWARIIRYPGQCAKCSSVAYLQAHHLHGKGCRGTRFQLANGICLCPSCHKFGSDSAHTSLLFYEWLRTERPKQYQWVLSNYNREEHRTYKEIYKELKEMG